MAIVALATAVLAESIAIAWLFCKQRQLKKEATGMKIVLDAWKDYVKRRIGECEMRCREVEKWGKRGITMNELDGCQMYLEIHTSKSKRGTENAERTGC